MTRRPRVLVVYKKDAYQQYVLERKDAHFIRLLKRRHADALDLRRSHRVHQRAIDTVVRVLRAEPVEVDMAARAGLEVRRRYDLVVSVGGDGTFLQAARSVGGTPILGVNSDPSRSEAVYSASTPESFPSLIKRALSGRLRALRIFRLSISLNGRALPVRALNDVLVTHDHPATMSRCRLRVKGRVEFQKSSGLWVATAAGSSSAVLAAGGKRLPWGAARFQYRPRELYRGRLSRCRLRGGLLGSEEQVSLVWLMRQGSMFIDGPHVRIPLRFADRVDIRLSLRDPLTVLGLGSRPD